MNKLFDTEDFKRFAELLNISKEIPDFVRRAVLNRTIPDLRFLKWLQEPRQKMLKYLGVVLVLFSALHLTWNVISRLYSLNPTDRSDNLLACSAEMISVCHVFDLGFNDDAISYLEVALLLLVISYITSKGQRNPDIVENPVLKAAYKAENRFFDWWPYLWFSWFVLYLLIAIKQLNAGGQLIPIEFKGLLPALLDFANNLTALFFSALFVELSNKTDQRTTARQASLPLFLVFLLLFAGEWASLASSPVADTPEALWGVVSGLITGLCTALVVARLASSIFGLPLLTVIVLTLYGVMQPLGPYLTHASKTGPANPSEMQNALPHVGATLSHPSPGALPSTSSTHGTGDGAESPKFSTISSGLMAAAVAMLALYGKLTLLFVVEWKRDEHRILWYMVRVRRLVEEEEEKKLFHEFTKVVNELERSEAHDELASVGPLRFVAQLNEKQKEALQAWTEKLQTAVEDASRGGLVAAEIAPEKIPRPPEVGDRTCKYLIGEIFKAIAEHNAAVKRYKEFAEATQQKEGMVAAPFYSPALIAIALAIEVIWGSQVHSEGATG